MRAVDTNVIVRVMLRDDAHQVAAAEAFIATGAWVSTLVFTEAIWVAATVYHLSAHEILTTAEMLLDHEHLFHEDYGLVRAALDLFRLRPRLRFSDCMLIEIARKAGHLPFGTFDRDLAKVEGAVRL
jgi:predicted nucleic-acid-binding protein